MGATIAEKVLARASGRDRIRPGEIVVAKVDRTRVNDTRMGYVMRFFEKYGVQKLWDPDRFVMILEHQVPPSNVTEAEALMACRQFAKRYGVKNFFEIGRGGICHQVFVENGFARPGELVAANDSHTCMYGALNTVARGIGIDDAMYVMVKGELWFKVPETVRVELKGQFPDMVSAKDIVLHIAGTWGTDFALYKSIEYVGEAAREMSLSSRMTIANMGIELGAKFALFEADEKTLEYLRPRVNGPLKPVFSDPDADLAAEYVIDVDRLEPLVACPHDPSNVKPVSEVKGIRIDQAFLGSCTNARMEDLEVGAALIKGRTVHPDVRLIVTPASQAIYMEALRKGLLETFLEAGAVVTNSTCGPCGGGSLGLLGPGERCISSSNRNFKGRMGSPEAEIYLASPATVVASAIAGEIIDPRIVQGARS